MKYFLLSFLFFSFSAISQITTTINFEDDTKWIAGSGSITSYQTDHQYNDGIFSSTVSSGLRNGNGLQDGVAGAIDNYSWRIKNTSGAFFEANIASGGVSTFTMMVRQWDGSPEAIYTLEYSTDGSTWNTIQTVDNTQWANSSNFVQIGGTINNSNANIKIRLTNVSGERVMVDNFIWTDNSVPSCATYSTITPSACVNYTSPSGNYTWSSSNTYKDTIQNAAMCDSIITINLTINQPETVNTTASICTGQTYTFGTQTLTDADAGTHTEVFTRTGGLCDSTVNLTLSVVSSYNETATATICEGETYVFGMQNLTVSGPYTETFTSVGLCDSIVNLMLTVTPRTYNTITVTECNSYTSPSGNYTWTASNTYNDTIPNAANCDSVITINLTINNSTSASISESVCGSYDFLGNNLTASGVYIDTIPNAVNCDSIITLTLNVTPVPGAPTVSSNESYCENENIADMTASGMEFGELIIAGVADGPLSGGTPKVVEFYAIQDIADLSIYGFGSANNGGGTDGEEFTFPALSLTAGDYYYVSLDSTNFNDFFGFYPNYSEGTASNINGDDAIELFKNGVVVDVFGDINQDGTNTPWDYLDGWAYRNNNSFPNGGVFNIAEWTFSGVNGLENGTTNATCDIPYPNGTLSITLPTSTITWYSDVTLMNPIGTSNTQSPSATIGAIDYYVTETISGGTSCEGAASTVTITVNQNPTVTFSTLSDICENASDYTLVEGAPSGGTYSGNGVTSGVFSPSNAGAGTETLTYTYTDVNNCTASATQTITVKANPTVTFGALATVCDYNPSMVLTGGSPTGGTYSGPGVTAGNFDPATAGIGTHTITYSYTDGNGCDGSATSSIIVDGCASIDETNTIGLSISPNPTNGLITIQFEGNSANINIVDITGKTVSQLTMQSNESVDLSYLNAGTYFINVEVEGIISTERIIVK